MTDMHISTKLMVCISDIVYILLVIVGIRWDNLNKIVKNWEYWQEREGIAEIQNKVETGSRNRLYQYFLYLINNADLLSSHGNI